jgi:hypothetical protein
VNLSRRTFLTGGLLLTGLPIAAQSPGRASFRVMQRGRRIGAMQAIVSRDADGWRIQSTGRAAGTVNVTVRQFDARYSPDWRARFLTVERISPPGTTLVHVVVGAGTAHTDVVLAKEASWRSHSVSPDTLFLPEHAYGALEAVAARLRGAGERPEIPLLVAPDGEQRAIVDAWESLTVPTASGPLRVSRHTLSIVGTAPRLIHVWERGGRLVRADLPEHGISVIRDDVVE